MRACGCGERKSLQCAMRGREMSSANRVCPVTFARPSTRRRGTPITRKPSPLVVAPFTDDFDSSFMSGIGPLGASFVVIRSETCSAPSLLLRDLHHRSFHSFENL